MTANDIVQINREPWDARNVLRTGLPWLGLAALGMTAFYWTGLVSLLDAWTLPEYSHGYFIPAVAGFLILRAMRDVEPHRDAADGRRIGIDRRDCIRGCGGRRRLAR